MGLLSALRRGVRIRPAKPSDEWVRVFRGATEPHRGDFAPNPGWYGRSISTTTDPDVANFYARKNTSSRPEWQEGANIQLLEARGPFVTDEQFAELARAYMRGKPQTLANLDEANARAVEKLRSLGYSGVRARFESEVAIFPDSGAESRNLRPIFGGERNAGAG